MRQRRLFAQRGWYGLAAAVCGLVATVGCAHGQANQGSLVIDHRCIDAADRIIPQAALDRVRQTAIVLGHESVGWNVIGGLKSLNQNLGQRYRLEIQHQITARWNTNWFDRHRGFGDFFVGNANNVPGKAQAFEQALRAGLANQVQVASLKLCWADLQDRTNTDAVFATYTQVLERLQQAYPRLTFVYWTMPLRRDGRLQDKRTRFNELMAQYARQRSIVLFDLADIEAHQPDGTEYRNETGQLAMWPGYTSDGGHLSEAGSQRAARGWWWLMARVTGWPRPQ